MARTLGMQPSQLRLNQQRVWRGHAMLCQLTKHAAAQRANHTTRFLGCSQRLGEHQANAGFAVSARNANGAKLLTRLPIEHASQFGQLLL